MAKREKKEAKELLTEARARFAAASEADSENRRNAQDDLEFVHKPGAQWDEALRQERGIRPCYEFNKLRVTIKRIVNDIRANRPQGKVRAVEDNDKDTSSVLEGLIRNIWNCSDADQAVDNAAEYQVAGGMGAWRVVTEYSDDTGWDQEIRIKAIRNPFCLYPDPAAQDNQKRDARYWFLTSKITKEAFKAKYGEEGAVDFEGGEFDDDDDWQDEDSVRIAEYWYKKPVTKTIALLSNGASVDASEPIPQVDQNGQPITVVRQRQVQSHKICMVVMSGDRILEGPVEWAGSKFPFVVAYGESVVIDGKHYWFGLTRFAKDSQRLHNFNMTLAAETVALAPQGKFWATPEQALGHTENWARAHKENLPYRLYNADPKAPGTPVHAPGADVPVALLNLTQVSSEEIKAVTGIFDSSLGNKSNEQSGIAIRARQAQGEIATFNFSDNIARAIRYTWEILIDLVPKVYDTERSIRILGTDGAEQYAKVNSIDPATGQALNDLSRGKFDVTVTSGPSFSTQRQEAAEVYMGLAQANPAVFGVAGDLIFKSLDLPYADDMAERMKSMLPPPIQQMLQQKQQNGGKPLPPEAMAAMAQADQAMQMVQQQGMALQQAAQELEQLKAEAQTDKANADKAKSDVQVAIANLKVQEANLAKAEAEFKTMVAETQQRMVTEQGATEVNNDREQLSAQVQQALAAIQSQAAEFMQQSQAVIAEIMARTQPQVVVANQPRRKTVQMQGPGGKVYTATVMEE